uniref:Uncharacterized protein n=1 Tax=Rhizophora mucronata TaxID=61149 RepID=A0A2P2PVQ2_RHIMU
MKRLDFGSIALLQPVMNYNM